jgi:oxygen-independent coproporphyrinogen-3 oxidase
LLLYIHIPFCNSKCHYCAFGSYIDKFSLKDEYLEALLLQFDFEIQRFGIQKHSIESVYVGGGTPSTMNIEFYTKVFDKIEPYLKANIEITFEANPKLSYNSWLKDIKQLGANRVSFGVQSFNESKLEALGRNHTKKETIESVNLAKQSGFDNISIDILYDFHTDNRKILENDLEQAFSLPINHISAYSLIIEKNTKFQNQYELKTKGDGFGEFLFKEIEARGLKQYEISNFGLYQSSHNIGYWKHKEYIGLGYSAVGFLKDKRFYSKDTLFEYIKNPYNKNSEFLTINDIKMEKVLLGLRSCVGFDIDILNNKEVDRLEILLQSNKLYQQNGRCYGRNFLLADEISAYILS